MGSKLPVIALTSGEPAGIGPDLALMLARADFPARIVVIGDEEMLAARCRALGLTASLRRYVATGLALSDALEIDHVPLAHSARAYYLERLNWRVAGQAVTRRLAQVIHTPAQRLPSSKTFASPVGSS